MAESAAGASRILLLDFDGTLCLGDGPVLRYAAEIDGLMQARGLPADVLPRTQDFFDGGPGDDPDLLAAQDPWYVPLALARRAGLTKADLSPAFLATRHALDAGEIEVYADPAMLALLARLPAEVYVCLATNSPDIGMDSLLKRLGVVDLIDELATEQHKPYGMPDLLDRLLGEHGLTRHPQRLLSVGDNWRNDLAPAAARGCATAYVDRLGHHELAADLRAGDVAGLVPAIEDWLEHDE